MDNFLNSVLRSDEQYAVESEGTENLEESDSQDENMVPVLEDFRDEVVDVVSYIPDDSVCYVLDWIDQHPNRGEACLKHRWEPIRNRTYNAQFVEYRERAIVDK